MNYGQYMKSNRHFLAIFGDGSDGVINFDGTNTFAAFTTKVGNVYTLTRNIYGSSITVSAPVTIVTAGSMIYCNGLLTNAGSINRNGNAGQNGVNVTPGAGGAALANADIGGAPIGGAGGQGDSGGKGGSSDNGNAGSASNPSQSGANGGAGGASTGSTGGAGGTATFRPIRHYSETFLNGIGLLLGGASGGGGGGGDPGSGSGGGGGGGGSGGGLVVIYSYSVTNTGTISANGGTGGNGGPATGSGHGGSGGGGGGGGCVYLINFVGDWGTVTATGGVGGARGTGGTATAGSNGADGIVLKYNLPLGQWI